MKSWKSFLGRVLLILGGATVLSGCHSSEDSSAYMSVGVHYGVGWYDPWYYGPGYYPPGVIVTPPPERPDTGPRPEHPIVNPPPSPRPTPAPRPMPSIPSRPRPAGRR